MWLGRPLFKKDKTVLNVGGGSKSILLPPEYWDYKQVLLDIDPEGEPDVVCDARDLKSLKQNQYDAVYCAHNLEHYYRHEVPTVLAGFFHVLKDGGFVHIRVPDVLKVMRLVVEKSLDLEDILYTAPAGPVAVLDILYGYGIEIERSGQPFYAHKTGFSFKSLLRLLTEAGFQNVHTGSEFLEIRVMAFKRAVSLDVVREFGLTA